MGVYRMRAAVSHPLYWTPALNHRSSFPSALSASLRHQHRPHPRRGSRGDAGGGVLKDEAALGSDIEPEGGLEEGIGRRLAALVVLGADDGLEKFGDAKGAQGVEDDAAMAPEATARGFTP